MPRKSPQEQQEDGNLRYLSKGLRSVNLRAVHDIQEAVRSLINSLGGVVEIKRRYKSKQVFDDDLDTVDIDEVFARTKLRRDFLIPYGAVRDVEDGELEGVELPDFIRGLVGRTVRGKLVKAVFPYARVKRSPGA